MVILDEVVRDAKLCELGLVVSFHEKTARVAENIGEELPDSRERCVQSLQRGNGLGGSALRSGDPSPVVALSDYPIHRIMHSENHRHRHQKLNSVGLSNQTVAGKRYASADCSTGPNKRDGAQPWDNPSWGSEGSGGRSAPNRNSRFGPLARASQCFFYPRHKEFVNRAGSRGSQDSDRSFLWCQNGTHISTKMVPALPILEISTGFCIVLSLTHF